MLYFVLDYSASKYKAYENTSRAQSATRREKGVFPTAEKYILVPENVEIL
jgi:hypothetical protein